jgi:hypothetical protein
VRRLPLAPRLPLTPKEQECAAIRRGDLLITQAQAGQLPPLLTGWLWLTLYRQRYIWRWN